LLHQAGGVTDTRDVVALRFDRKIVQVDAAKNDSGFSGRGGQGNVAKDTGVQADSLGARGRCDGCLKHAGYLF
jgi:hypothetical protein